MLTKNSIYVNGEKTKNKKLYNYLIQKPNQKVLGTPLKLHIYNLARENADSVYLSKLNNNKSRKDFLRRLLSKKQLNRYVARKYDFNEWIKHTGEQPTILEESKTKKSKKRLEGFFWNRGWFNVSSEYEVVKEDSLKASANYFVTTHSPYIVSSFETNISSKSADSIYKRNIRKSYVKVGEQYNTFDLELERNRITKDFRSQGLFYFEKDYVKFDADTINTNKNIKLRLNIDAPSKQKEGILINNNPFYVYRLSRIKIYVNINGQEKFEKYTDTTFYNGFELYSSGELKYKEKAITNAVFLVSNAIYKDEDRALTYSAINNLGVFKYPTISFVKDPNVTNGLITSIYLVSRKKYAFGVDFNVTTSPIQDVGIGLESSLSIRNFFRRAETFEIAARSSLGSSQDVAISDNRFFNISEFGLDAKLKFPRIVFPFNTEKFIKKSSVPLTTLTLGVSLQRNIGLDKENVTGTLGYKWKPNRKISNELNLLDLQYVRNLNSSNYFNIYRNSFNRVNEIAKRVLLEDSEFFENGSLTIPSTVSGFLSEALQGNISGLSNENIIDLRNLAERRDRLTEDNLILSTNYSFVKDTRKNLYDEDFTRFRMRFETAGALLSSIAEIAEAPKNEDGEFSVFNVVFSQFVKTEAELIKHWDLGSDNIVAVRAFGGIAIPYGNSSSVPFSQSYFGGGSNDNRAWIAYDLGPGSSSGRNEFNEANFKLAFNLEYRFRILGDFKGALFADIGNIWNVLDDFEDEEDVTFSGIKDLEELALGTGLGFRYDFSFFVFRLDMAVKTHNPASLPEKRWLTDVSFDKVVFNVGINYPF